MKPTIFSIQTAHNVAGLPILGVRHLSIGDVIAVQWEAGDAIRHYEVQPDGETLHEVVLSSSVSASAYGEFADNLSYPEAAKVSMPAATWASTQALLASLPGVVQSLDILLDGTDTFLDDGNDVDAGEYGEDCLQFQCYRFKRHCAGHFTAHLVMAAKHHDTFVSYKLERV